jgi:hypothetical protein
VSDELNSSQVNLDPFDDGLNGVLPVSFSVYNKDWEGDLFVNILIDWNQDGDWENATSNGPDPKEWAVQNMLLKIPKDETRAYTTNVSLPKETWMRMTIKIIFTNSFRPLLQLPQPIQPRPQQLQPLHRPQLQQLKTAQQPQLLEE